MCKRNSCSWQPEHHIISGYEGLQFFFKFSEIAHLCHEILHFKNHGFRYILYYGGQGCPPQYKMYEKTMIFKHPYLMMYMCNLFEILKHYCTPYLLML